MPKIKQRWSILAEQGIGFRYIWQSHALYSTPHNLHGISGWGRITDNVSKWNDSEYNLGYSVLLAKFKDGKEIYNDLA